MKKSKIPLTLKIIFTAFLAVLIPIYWVNYGPTNFLWISDISLFLCYLAVMFENKLFASMAAIEGLILESFWTISFVLALFFGMHFSDLVEYMFDPALPLWLRGLSLFHLALPPLFIWLVSRLGYVQIAWVVQTVLTTIVLGVTWLITDPAKNINWVYTYQKIEAFKDSPLLYLVLEALGIGIIFFITHLFLRKVFLAKPSHKETLES